MVEEYKRRQQGACFKAYEYFLSPQKAFAMFLDYVGDDELLGHNLDYDIHILENNISRRTSGLTFHPLVYWDTLKLSRLLDPNLSKHSLETLLEVYELEGSNSHNAFEDIGATHSLALYLYSKVATLLSVQKEFLSHPEVKSVQTKLIKKYLPIYKHTVSKLYSTIIDAEHSFIEEFKYAYTKMVQDKNINVIPMFNYMCELFDKVVINCEKDKYFHQQLTNHLYEFRTFNESDFFQNEIITEKVHVMTIHKAKGLEFDNVILPNISDGVFPPAWSKNTAEDGRVLYVGMSRARKRIYITYISKLSPFILNHSSVHRHFYEMPEKQRDMLLKLAKSI